MILYQMTLPHMDILLDVADKPEDSPHEHKDKYQLLIPLQGNVISHFTNHSYSLTHGFASVKNPETVHWHDIREPTKSLIFSWKREEFVKWCQTVLVDDREWEFYEKQEVDAAAIMKQMNRWSADCLNAYDLEATTMCIQAEVFNLLATFIRGSHELKSTLISSQVILDSYIKDAVQFIEHHYKEAISLNSLIIVSRQSKYHFIRSFKKHTGYSPYQYILQLRIQTAKELLVTSSMTLQDISEELGFSSPSHLHRTFYNLVGISPGEYRKKS